ncbi:MAG: hypothetical protein ACRC2J_04480 [Microcoleaceae cyanobacterium]|jgi:hypothetical protein
MFTIDVIAKYTPAPFSVQRKNAEDAEALYQQVLSAIETGNPKVLELTCEKMPDKKVAVLSSEIIATQISQKSGSQNTGKPPGFMAMVE